MTSEVNFDGLVGLTHNYSGLSYGNVASSSNQFIASNPREAALQGLEKMKFLSDLGIVQAVLPPHERPHLPTLRKLGYRGTDSEMVRSVLKETPKLLLEISSAASMWTANAATVCPSQDSFDKKVHFTSANLTSKFHRSIEAATTEKVLKKIFSDETYFVHHSPLPPGSYFCDEGAANHNRFCKTHDDPGTQLFVFGRYSFDTKGKHPSHFPARQTYEASMAIARLHRLDFKRTLFVQQQPLAIDAGAFHNDVVSVANRNVFFFHEQAFLNKDRLIETLQNTVEGQCGIAMVLLEVKSQDVSLEESVNSYLFNSQIVDLNDGTMAMMAPSECQENARVSSYLKNMLALPGNPIKKIHYFNLKQSMFNGGGPACLRMRVVLTSKEKRAAHPHIFLTETLYQQLKTWIKKYYRDRFHPDDLADPQLLLEGHEALNELTHLLHLGPIYDFQSLNSANNLI